MAQRSLSRVRRRLPDADDHPNYVSFIHISVLTFQQVFVDGYFCAAWLEQLIIIIIKKNKKIIIIIIGKFITHTCSQALSMNRRCGQSLGG